MEKISLIKRAGTVRPRRRDLQEKSALKATAALGLILLTALPLWALSRLLNHVDWWVLPPVILGVSIVSYLMQRTDKRRALAGEWRISEASLHFFELLGGWPGSFIAQRKFRHKISKASYQTVFWLIVMVYQFLAVDSFWDWKMSNGLSQVIDGRPVKHWFWSSGGRRGMRHY